MKKIILCLVLLILALLPACTREGSELTSGIYGNDEFRIRLSVFNDYFTLLLICMAAGNEEYEVIAGFSTPLILFGPVYRYGLFKEMFNPLTYTPGSTVFREKSDLRLNKAFEPGKRRFLEFSLVPGYCSLFLQTGEDTPLFCGGQLSVGIGEFFFQDVLVSFSVPLAKYQDTWYTDSYLFPGGNIYHLGTKILVQIPSFYFSLTGIVSGGEIIMPGYFLNCSVSNKQDWSILSLILGYCSGYYITPDGSYTDRMLRAGGSVDFSPFPLFSIDLSYFFDLDHPSPFPLEYIPATNTIDGEVCLKQYIQRETLMELALSSHSVISFDEQGRETENHEITFSTGFCRRDFSGEAALSLPVDQGKEIIPEWKTDLSFHHGIHTFSLNNLLFFGKDLSWKGSLDYRAAFNPCEVRLSFSCKKPINFIGQDFKAFKDNPFDFILLTLNFQVLREHAVSR